MVRLSRALSRKVNRLEFSGKVKFVYNPLTYAAAANEQYLSKYATGSGVALMLGMNPGPWGMAQTGVPFGEIAAVRDWLGIDAKIRKPKLQHPKRPVLGFDCERREVSGARLWGWAQDRYKKPERFFNKFFVWNYCPLSFMVESGANYTPDKLSKEERNALFDVCDDALRKVVDVLEPSRVIGIGKFAEKRAQIALAGRDDELPISTILHPSPASPMANKGWVPHIERQLEGMGIRLPS